MKYEFTDRETCLLADGILRLIEDASKSYLLCSASAKAQRAIRSYINELKELNTKICKEA